MLFMLRLKLFLICSYFLNKNKPRALIKLFLQKSINEKTIWYYCEVVLLYFLFWLKCFFTPNINWFLDDNRLHKIFSGLKSRLQISFELKRYFLAVFFQSYFPALSMVFLAGMSMWIDPKSTPARVAMGEYFGQEKQNLYLPEASTFIVTEKIALCISIRAWKGGGGEKGIEICALFSKLSEGNWRFAGALWPCWKSNRISNTSPAASSANPRVDKSHRAGVSLDNNLHNF